MDGDDGLDDLRLRIAACRICRDQPARGPAFRLPHEPRPVAVLSRKARILIAGQAPGLRVHRSGLPFDDASGDRLRDWLGVDRATFYDRDRFAVAAMGFCFPGYDAKGGDLPPRRECAPAWRPAVMAAMPSVDLVLAIGRHAQLWHLGARAEKTVAATVRRFGDYCRVNAPPMVMPLPHPSWRNTAWLRANPWFAEDLLPLLKSLVKDRIA
ncbi:uracil-DNA glycosylase family protein [Ensifer soli]|uniref:uracil-DNA glycosylase family protein n=1 Tax=Ciceribacter sp. sgz301302 TaxID=3342379 RepID=UPI0035BA2476